MGSSTIIYSNFWSALSHRAMLVIVLLTLPGLNFAANARGYFPGITKLMTDNEFKQSGLNKLSKEELIELNKWLKVYTLRDARVMAKSLPRRSLGPIKSLIVGDFKGFSGKTKVKLENGQVWQQRQGDIWRVSLKDKEVLIEEGNFGYRMRFKGLNRTIGVKRIK